VAQGCDTLVSIGNIQSDHTRRVAAVAAVLGMRCRLVQEEWTCWDDPVYDKVGNILLSRLMGAETVLEGQGYSTAVKETWEHALAQVRREGGKPYPIPAGASDHPLGGLGYAHFADKVAGQERAHSIFFDTVVTASCTGLTQAGMVVGFGAQTHKRRVIGIDTAAAVMKIARATAALVGLHRDIRDEEVEIDSRFAGPDYGLPDESTIAAILMAARLEALLTDPVYEGKSMAGCRRRSRVQDHSRKGSGPCPQREPRGWTRTSIPGRPLSHAPASVGPTTPASRLRSLSTLSTGTGSFR